MMERFRSLTVAYTAACLVTGAFRQLMPESSGKKVIKAVTGLYILLTVLHGMLGVGQIAADFSWQDIPSSAGAAEAGAADSKYSAQLLRDVQKQLEENGAALLREQGISADVSAALECGGDTVGVARLTVTTASALSDAQKEAARSALSGFAPAEILFQTEETENGSERDSISAMAA